MKMTTTTAGRLLIITLALAAWSGFPTGASAGDQARAKGQVPRKASVKVIKQGHKPRRPLRYKLQVGDEQTMVMNMHMVMSVVGRQVDLPPMRMTAKIKVDKRTKDGNFHQALKFTDASVQARPNDPPSMIRSMRQSLKGMKGLTGSAVVTPRGRTIKMNLDIPPNASPKLRNQLKQTKQSLSRVSTLLPEKPMGEGGQWKVTQGIRNRAIKLTQTATYTIQHLDKKSMSVDIALTQSAPQQPMPGGVKLLKLESRGKGSMDVRFDKQVPDSDLQLNMHMKLARPNQAGNMTMDMKMDMDIAPLKHPDSKTSG